MRIAILADIHGNLHALEAVAAELERLQPDHVILDGDLINAVPFSPEVSTMCALRTGSSYAAITSSTIWTSARNGLWPGMEDADALGAVTLADGPHHA